MSDELGKRDPFATYEDRLWIADNALTSVEMAGFEFTEEEIRVMRKFVTGELNLAETTEELMALDR